MKHVIVIGGGAAGCMAAVAAAQKGAAVTLLERNPKLGRKLYITGKGRCNVTNDCAAPEVLQNVPRNSRFLTSAVTRFPPEAVKAFFEGLGVPLKTERGNRVFPCSDKAADIIDALLLALRRSGVHIVQDRARALRREGEILTGVEGERGFYPGGAVVIATGASPRSLGVPGEDALVGKGVHYCAACDGAPYRGKTVAVVGGGNSAAADALTLSRIAQKVYLIHRRDSLRATKVYHEPLMSAPNVEFCWNSTVSALLHDSRLTGLRLKDVNTGAEHDLACDGVFISVGRAPATELFRDNLALDSSGYIIADDSTRTNLPGVFAAGDVRTKALRQVVTAVSDGAVAVHYAEEYLAENW